VQGGSKRLLRAPEERGTIKEANVVSEELLEILRCPSCVREDRPTPGLLEQAGNWLICVDCDRKYPIRDDIPVMLIEEGDRFRAIPASELPAEPPPEEALFGAVLPTGPRGDRQQQVLGLIGLALGLAVVLTLAMWLLRRGEEDE
jgi:uncharacterized protein YbaR (Trm112 family)